MLLQEVRISSLLLTNDNIERILVSFRNIVTSQEGFTSDMIFEPIFIGVIKGTITYNSVDINIIYKDFLKGEPGVYKSIDFRVTYFENYKVVSCEFLKAHKDAPNANDSAFIFSTPYNYDVFKYLR